MWRTAESRCAQHFCVRHPFRPFHFGIPSIQSLPEAGSWERQYAPPVLHYACIMPIPSLYLQKNKPGCIMPIPSLQLQKKALVSCREAKRLVKQLCSPRFVTIQWLCSQLCYVTAANQWAVVEIELLATVGWKCGCQPFSCPCSQNVTHCRKQMCTTCLCKTSIPAVPFWNSKHPVSTRSRFLRAQYPPPVLQHGCIMNHARPFVATSEKNQSHAEKQRVWSRSCGLQDLFRAIQWLCPRFGLQDIDGALSCDTWLLQTNEQLSRLSF